MVEAICIFETSVNFYETKRRNIPEGYLQVKLVLYIFICRLDRRRVDG
jgi:hypothetical protein